MEILGNMGLVAWNEITDSFSHEQLAANFKAIDEHDHSSGKGAKIPAGGIQTGAVTAEKLAENAVEEAKIKTQSVTDAKLYSPNNGVYRVLSFAGGTYGSSVSGTKHFVNGPALVGSPTVTSAARSLYLASADYSVNGKTPKLRIRAVQTTANAAPAVTLTVGMYPISAIVAGAFTVGAVTAGSTVAFSSTAANTRAVGTSTEFALPSDGYYIFGVANSGTTAASSEHSLHYTLQIKHV